MGRIFRIISSSKLQHRDFLVGPRIPTEDSVQFTRIKVWLAPGLEGQAHPVGTGLMAKFAGERVPGRSARPLDQYLLDVLTIEVNRIECSLR
ncbi:MAG: hypothetical protein ABI833_01125 [Acidobacteriota bacterium]